MSSLYHHLHAIFTKSVPANTIAKANLNSLPNTASTKGTKPQVLVDKFNESSELDSFRNNQVIYHLTVCRLAAAKKFSMELFDELPELNCESSVRSFNTLLTAYVNAKKFDKVVEIFHELPSTMSIESDVISYNIVIHAHCKIGSLDSAISTFDALESKGIEPDLITFNKLLNALYRDQRCS